MAPVTVKRGRGTFSLTYNKKSRGSTLSAQRYLTTEQWAAERQIRVETVRRQIRQGRIRAVNNGDHKRPVYRIPISERDRYDRDNAA